MAVVLSLRWPGVTPAQYDTVRDAVRWEDEEPEGAVLHVAWFEGGSLHVIDVWNSQADFERFFSERLVSAIKEADIAGEPETEFSPLYRRFVASGISGAA
ncbi:hypothetical protein ACI2L1_08640 [Streptomyces sp. NPDC019531]|uniref:hypothetical protein n=1 Tax=Streptomyces sp. NPDC019531 TaxID=3365062 RepID=UPI003850E193